MRLALIFAMSAALGMAARNNVESTGATPTQLTIVLDFEGRYSDESLAEMKRETAFILKEAGLVIDWRLRSGVGHDAFANLILVELKGECVADQSRRPQSVRGPLAFSHTTSTSVMRFADIQCDAVRRLVGSTNGLILGKALGRVLAHELWHILGNTFAHGENGVAQRALSVEQLISGRLDLDAADLGRFRLGLDH